MKVSEKFASNFLKAEDLQGRRVHVVIASVGEEKIGDDSHVVVYFRGKQKSLICNKTNASYLAAAISDETDDWPGHEIILYPTKVNFQGRMVDAIRVETLPSAGNGAGSGGRANAYAAAKDGTAAPSTTPPAEPVQPAKPFADDLNDEIPF